MAINDHRIPSMENTSWNFTSISFNLVHYVLQGGVLSPMLIIHIYKNVALSKVASPFHVYMRPQLHLNTLFNCSLVFRQGLALRADSAQGENVLSQVFSKVEFNIFAKAS